MRFQNMAASRSVKVICRKNFQIAPKESFYYHVILLKPLFISGSVKSESHSPLVFEEELMMKDDKIVPSNDIAKITIIRHFVPISRRNTWNKLLGYNCDFLISRVVYIFTDVMKWGSNRFIIF